MVGAKPNERPSPLSIGLRQAQHQHADLPGGADRRDPIPLGHAFHTIGRASAASVNVHEELLTKGLFTKYHDVKRRNV